MCIVVPFLKENTGDRRGEEKVILATKKGEKIYDMLLTLQKGRGRKEEIVSSLINISWQRKMVEANFS